MAYCPACGHEVDDSAVYCSECGAELDAEPTGEPSAEPEVAAKTASDIDGGVVAVAVVVGLILGFVAYFLVSLTVASPLLWAFPVGWAAFGYLTYRGATGPHDALANGLFYGALLLFLLPVAMVLFSIAFASGETTAAGQAGAAIGGFILAFGAFIIGWPLGVVLYLLSGRMSTSGDSE